MKLFYAPGACSMAVHIALRDIDARFDAVLVDLTTHTASDGADYHAISPRGYVPLLQLDDGSHHTEVVSLLQYVADLEPHHRLIGDIGSTRRLEVVEWLAFISSELHKAFSPWLWQKETAESTRQAVQNKLATRFAEMNQLLATRTHLAGDYSVADAYAFTILNWVNFLGLSLTPYPHLKSYLMRIGERPSVQEVMRTEGLTK